MRPLLFWFRRDLRLADNIALTAAAATGQPIIPVYVLDSQDTGGASRWWLHHSLAALSQEIVSQGGELLVLEGRPEEQLLKLANRTGATEVFFQHRYEPESREQERRLAESITLYGFHDNLVTRPEALTTKTGGYYRVFTPFWRAASTLGEPPAPLPVPGSLRFVEIGDTPAGSADLGLLPRNPDWSGGLRETWSPGEMSAAQTLDGLEETVRDYADYRDRPDIDATSRLSPHLHFGEVSPRQVWHGVRRIEMQQEATPGAEALLRQLYWREFSAYLLYHYPKLPDQPLRPEFEHFPWLDDAEGLRAWQTGRTGYPIVDAGMRQLWHTGWMHNRVRMIAASFLVKDLMIPWQRGADWFMDTLVDADAANNSASWQWVAGCGTDAAPYFRIFNPLTQAQKFDPDGAYVRRWVPELAEGTYPGQIVDHKVARQRALAAYDSIRGMRISKSAPTPAVSNKVSEPPCADATSVAR